MWMDKNGQPFLGKTIKFSLLKGLHPKVNLKLVHCSLFPRILLTAPARWLRTFVLVANMGPRFINPARANPQMVSIYGGKSKYLATAKNPGWGTLVMMVTLVVVTECRVINHESWSDKTNVHKVKDMRRIKGRMIDGEMPRVRGFMATAYRENILVITTNSPTDISWTTMVSSSDSETGMSTRYPFCSITLGSRLSSIRIADEMGLPHEGVARKCTGCDAGYR
jgi:hypothetical protein